MASCGGGCQPECLRNAEEAADVAGAEGEVENRSGSGGLCPADGDRALCSKCREHAAACNNLCGVCFRSSLFGKFKLAVTHNAMISPTDNVLVAVSGGPASRSQDPSLPVHHKSIE